MQMQETSYELSRLKGPRNLLSLTYPRLSERIGLACDLVCTGHLQERQAYSCQFPS